MTLMFKLVAMLMTLATTLLLVFESTRRGLIIFWTIIGILKVIVFVAFLTLLLVIIYLLLTSSTSPKPTPEA